MNLHEICNDILIDYLRRRFPQYEFSRADEITIIYRYKLRRMHSGGAFETMTYENYVSYLRQAEAWQTRGRVDPT